MDGQIQKLKNLFKNNFGKTTDEIILEWGKPEKNYLDMDDMWLYTKKTKIIFKDKIIFIIKDNKISDIMIIECIMGIGLNGLYYNNGKKPAYEIINFFKI